MGKRNKFILLIIIGAVIFIVLRSVNSHLDKVTSAVNVEIRAQQAQGSSVDREPPVVIREQGLATVKPAITIIGAVPVETRSSSSTEQKREVGVFRSQASVSSNVAPEELASAPSSGIDVKQEPAKDRDKRIKSKEMIIF